MPAHPRFRQARNSDATDLIELVADCFAAYPGCVLDVPGEEPVLAAPADRLERCWVAEDSEGVVRAMVAAADGSDATGSRRTVELKKLYVWAGWRRRGVASALTRLVEVYAMDRGAGGIFLWSDTRFTAAHALYRALGYAATGRTRLLHDRSDTEEFEFTKVLPRA